MKEEHRRGLSMQLFVALVLRVLVRPVLVCGLLVSKCKIQNVESQALIIVRILEWTIMLKIE